MATIKKLSQFQQICADLRRSVQICAELYVAEPARFLALHEINTKKSDFGFFFDQKKAEKNARTIQ